MCSARSGELARGDLLDRYLILDPLGTGAMGEVYRAFDPELDRKVAIKVLGAARDDGTASDRLQREALALARLHHPNVISIFDVGTVDGRVFLAMELVEGETLEDVLSAGAMQIARTIDVFLGAGSGLAAAHEAGLCHRDFKPANVLIAADGVAKVVDFGLARPEEAADSGAVARGRLEVADAEDPLSREGAVAGTPAYMAPEVKEGERADARSDQYSFCVALHEALAGGRPPRPLPRGVPGHVRRVVARGLASDPADRFGSMDALLDALRRDPRVLRRRLLLVAGAVGVGAVLQYGFAVATEDDPCADSGSRWDGVWDDQRRRDVAAALTASGAAYADDVAVRVEAGLDAYVAAWTAAAIETCRLPPSTVQQARGVCLERRLVDVAAVIEALADADDDMISHAVQAVPAAEGLDACSSDAVLLGAVDPPPAAIADDVDALRVRLAEVKALERTGRYPPGLALAEGVYADAETVPYPAVRAEAGYRFGRLQELTGDYDGALDTLRTAHWTAEGMRDDRLAADAAAHVVFVLGAQKGELERALEWGSHAQAAIERAGGDKGAQAELLNNLGSVQAKAGEYAESRRLYVEALELKQELFGPESYEVALVRMNVAVADEELGDYTAAKEQHRLAIAAIERSLGGRHPSMGMALGNVAATEFRNGEVEKALQHYRESLEIKREALGPDHPSAVYPLDGIAMALRRLGRLDESEAFSKRASELAEKVLGKDHPFYAQTLHNYGVTLKERGDYEQAREVLTGAYELWREQLGDAHPHVAIALSNLAGVQSELGDVELAIETMTRARDIYEKAVPGHPQVGVMTANIGQLHHEAGHLTEARRDYEGAKRVLDAALPAGHPDRATIDEFLGELATDEGDDAAAVALLEPALEVRESTDSTPVDLARTRFALARALWSTDPDRARALARAAWQTPATTFPHRSLRQDIQTWLAAH